MGSCRYLPWFSWAPECSVHRPSSFAKLCLAAVFYASLAAGISPAQGTGGVDKSKPTQKPQDSLQQRYDAARTFQIAGDQEKAAAEYKVFLTQALTLAANARANSGDLKSASQLLDEAATLSPDDKNLNLSRASTLLRAGKLAEAKSLLDGVLQADPRDAQAHYLLGSILFRENDLKGAKEHLEEAVVAAPNFPTGYLLGLTYLKLNDLPRTELLFNEMLSGLGESAQIHMYFGRAYREAGQLDKAVEEFKKAVARDGKAAHVHYFLGLAYLKRDSDAGFE